MDLDEIYFWTNTIKDWKELLINDNYKQLIINSLEYLTEKNKKTVYAFVIMPNRRHLVWKLNQLNGKEMPPASFNKFTAHEIIKDLKHKCPKLLQHFEDNDKERDYRVWQRDALAVLMDSKEKVEQKIEYIHNNPFGERWGLAQMPEEYYWSSAGYYELGKDDFGFLSYYMEVF